ncbi:MAG: sugar transferase [Eubacteriales bacterium]|nr:sugar transferase [Eubacteriales bacterium]
MNPKVKVIQTYGLWLADMICILVSYVVATQMRFAVSRDWGDKTLHYMVCVVFLLFCTVYSFFVDWNRDYMVRGYFQELMAVIKYNVVMLVITILFVFFAQWAYILSRSVIAWFLLFNLILMMAVHLILKKILHKVLSNDLLVSKVIVIAQRDQMEATLDRLMGRMDVSYQIVAAVYADGMPEQGAGAQETAAEGNAVSGTVETSTRLRGIPVLSGLEHLTREMIQVPFDEVFINTPDISQKKMRGVIHGFEEMGVVCHYNLELPDIGEATSKVDTFGDYTTITYTRFRSSYKRLMIKRLIDILGGLVGLILTGILTLFLAPAIKLDSPGPVFFSQTRVGKNGRRFKIYKYRSMYRDAEERKKELMKNNEMSGLMFKMENDPRITKVGAFIRKTSLDEFPQFLNVFKGDMSLVGTRPPTEAEFEQYNEHYRRRISMTPGLTGLWQVSGRSEITDFDEVVKLDLEYIDNWSLTLDFKILLQTVGVVLFSKGAK